MRALSIISLGYFLYGVVILYFVIPQAILISEAFYEISSLSIFSVETLPYLSFIIISLTLASMAFFLSYLLFKRKSLKTVRVLSGILVLGIPIGTVLGIVTQRQIGKKEVLHEFES